MPALILILTTIAVLFVSWLQWTVFLLQKMYEVPSSEAMFSFAGVLFMSVLSCGLWWLVRLSNSCLRDSDSSSIP